MPCDSRVPIRLLTKLSGLDFVKQAAEKLGLTVTQYGTTSLMVYEARTGTQFEYYVDGETIGIETDRSDRKRAIELNGDITKAYAEIRLKQFAQQKRMSVSRDPNEQDTFYLAFLR